MNELRQELRDLLFCADSIRPAALRRSYLEDWLYATDLPQAAPEETVVRFRRKAEEKGWRTALADGWIQLDRIPETFPSGLLPAGTGREAACCRSILERHPEGKKNGDREKRLLLKAAEKGPEEYERICAALHREWAAALRKHENLPDLPAEYFGEGKEQC